MHLIQLLLPLATSVDGQKARFEPVLDELAARFGGVTAFVNSPARGLWQTGHVLKEDRIVTVEVMVPDLDSEWWADYRKTLEARFNQQELVVRAISITQI